MYVADVTSLSMVVEASEVLIGIGVAIVALVFLAAMGDALAVRSERRQLRAVRREPAVASAVSEILLARDHFSRVVAKYENAIAAQSRLRTLTLDGVTTERVAPDPAIAEIHPEVQSSAGGPEIERLLIQKSEARQRLVEAQNLWDAVRPGARPSAEADLWFGSGLMRAWQLGPIGFERFYYRFDHAVDPSCWVIFEASRFRFGIGLGAETQTLALFAAGASADELGDLSGLAFGGPEVAFRPGFVPMRTWRRTRRSPHAKAANKALLQSHSVRDLAEGLSSDARSLAVAAFEVELGESLTRTTELPDGPALISVITKGPSVLLGAWAGSTPTPKIRGRSDHGVWKQRP